MAQILNPSELFELYEVVEKAYDKPGVRTMMREALSEVVRGGLAVEPPGGPLQQAISDLNYLNGVRPVDGTCPLETLLSHTDLFLRSSNASAAHRARETVLLVAQRYEQQNAEREPSFGDDAVIRALSTQRPTVVGTLLEEVSKRVASDNLRGTVADIIHEARGTPLGDMDLEGINSGYSRLGPDFFRNLLDTCTNVARVYVDDAVHKQYGTGWMLTPELLMTCWHVLAYGPGSIAQLEEIRDRTSLVRLHFGETPPTKTGDNPDVSEATLVSAHWGDPVLDFAILRIKPHTRLVPLRISKSRLEVRPGVFFAANIPQYALGGHLEIGTRANEVTHTTETTLRYNTDTEKGSSGSPVCDDAWRVRALHRKNGNEGTQIAAILDWLRSHEPTVYEEIENDGDIV